MNSSSGIFSCNLVKTCINIQNVIYICTKNIYSVLTSFISQCLFLYLKLAALGNYYYIKEPQSKNSVLDLTYPYAFSLACLCSLRSTYASGLETDIALSRKNAIKIKHTHDFVPFSRIKILGWKWYLECTNMKTIYLYLFYVVPCKDHRNISVVSRKTHL